MVWVFQFLLLPLGDRMDPRGLLWRKMMGGHEHDRCPLFLLKVTNLSEESNQMMKEQLKELGCLDHRREDLGMNKNF